MICESWECQASKQYLSTWSNFWLSILILNNTNCFEEVLKNIKWLVELIDSKWSDNILQDSLICFKIDKWLLCMAIFKEWKISLWLKIIIKAYRFKGLISFLYGLKFKLGYVKNYTFYTVRLKVIQHCFPVTSARENPSRILLFTL